jgi:hypothetical protein
MSLTRTFTVILVGIAASFLVMATASHLILKPVNLAIKMQNANRSDNDRTIFQQDFQRAHWLSVLLINPSIGLVVGLFVGFFQKTRASITAAACLLPQFLFRLYANGWAGWSDERLPPLLAHQFLVFLPAIVVAHYVWGFKNRRAVAA